MAITVSKAGFGILLGQLLREQLTPAGPLDPLSLGSRCRALFRANVGQWQDVAGLIPAVSLADPVARWDDASLYANAALQASAAHQPTILTGLGAGHRGVKGNGGTAGAGARLVQTVTGTLSQPFAVFAAFRWIADSLSQVWGAAGSLLTSGRVNSADDAFSIQATNSLTLAAQVTGDHAVAGLFDGTFSLLQVDDAMTAGDVGLTGWNGLALLASASGNQGTQSAIIELALIESPTIEEFDRIHTWMRSLAGT